MWSKGTAFHLNLNRDLSIQFNFHICISAIALNILLWNFHPIFVISFSFCLLFAYFNTTFSSLNSLSSRSSHFFLTILAILCSQLILLKCSQHPNVRNESVMCSTLQSAKIILFCFPFFVFFSIFNVVFFSEFINEISRQKENCEENILMLDVTSLTHYESS